MIITIGGDGTILRAAGKATFHDVPILGINLGRLGFLAGVESPDIEKLITREKLQNATIEERIMLHIIACDGMGNKSNFWCLNEVSLIRAFSSRITDFEITINDKLYDVYPADGILVATPTGSTAYNLSAGGPIVAPYSKDIILTPICPHTIYSRSIILTERDTIGIKMIGEEQLNLCIDGEAQMNFTKRHSVQVKKSSKVVKLVQLGELDFLQVLKTKIVGRRK